MTLELPDECEEWISWLADEFEKLDNALPELNGVFFMDREWPDWVMKMVQELIPTLYPAAKLKVGTRWTPAELGSVVRLRIAYFQRLCEPAPWPGLDVDKLNREMKEDERARAERWAETFEGHAVKVYELTAAALALGLVRSHAESSSFITAFAHGLAMKRADV